MKALIRFLATAALAAGAATAGAQSYPTKPLRVIVPLSPGSGADIAGRIVTRHMSEAFGQPIVVDNRTGAGGVIGTQVVAKAQPDGYTLMIQSASHASNPAIYKKLPYDPLKDLVDVALLGVTPYVMITAPTGPYRSLKALVDAARAKPGELPFASAGLGTVTHLAAENFAQLAGVKMIHVPYKGSPEAIADSAAGRTTFYMAPVNTAIGLLRDGRLAALGVSVRKRLTLLPDVPTIAEQGYPDYDMKLWFGMWAPAGTPAAIVQRLNGLVAAALQRPDVVEQFGKLGIDPVTMKPAEFAKFVREEIAANRRIVKRADIQPL
jgi:tripartite-type tricarboxylate transporter receptor subunit TctC